MAKVSKRFLERARANLRRYQKVLEHARARDVLGYDKYEDVTGEVAVRATRRRRAGSWSRRCCSRRRRGPSA